MKTYFINLSFLVTSLGLSQLALAQTQDTITTFTYDAGGNLKTVTNALNHLTTYGYDSLSRRTSVIDAASGVTTYAFDGIDQLIEVKDPRAVRTVYSVDGLGNLVQVASPDSGVAINTYDEAGNLTSRTDAKLQKTTYKYDALNRLTLITYHDSTTVVHGYDQGPNAIGQLSSIIDSLGTHVYGYDAFGRIETETRTIAGVAYATSYRYDNSGRLSGMTYPSGRSVDYGFDTSSMISQITTSFSGATIPIVTQVNYEPFGPIKSVTFANGRSQVREYDLDGRVKTFALSDQTMAISYDPASRITAIKDAAVGTNGNTYGYNLLDQLTSVQTPGFSQTYSYDAAGNRKQKVNGAVLTSYSYGTSSNRLTQIGPLPLLTDANGSVTSKDSVVFNYDARGRMVSANTAIGLVTYTINSLGQRVRKVTPVETTVFHYDRGGKLIAESVTSGAKTTTQEYVYLGDMPVAVLK